MSVAKHLGSLRRKIKAWGTQRGATQTDADSSDVSWPHPRGATFGWAGRDLSRWDLSGADLRGADLSGVDLHGADLSEANLEGAQLQGAYLAGANLQRANLRWAELSETNLGGARLNGADLTNARFLKADLRGANLSEVDLSGADFRGADLRHAHLRSASLTGADLRWAILVQAELTSANLTGCRIFGIAAWKLKLEGAIQQNLVITEGDPKITVDNLEIAQFVYLLLEHEKIREVIDTITAKVVLILGRFTPERKALLDALREELRKSEHNYVPIVFDFDKPASRTTDETITLLARMARFVIVDISDAKSVLQELRAIVPNTPNIPVQPIITASQDEPGMFDFFHHFPWFLKVQRYDTPDELIAAIGDRVIGPAEAKVRELRGTIQPWP
jgi:uncharacterized protein YjbI with pentapeptide repeats